MTCIVALVEDGVVHMGADSAGVDGYALVTRKDPKIYRVGKFLFGFTTSFRMGQLLAYQFTPPTHYSETPVEEYMTTKFVDALRSTFKSGGYARTHDSAEYAGTFLVGYRGRIFHVCDDYQVGENMLPFDAVGCGRDAALGAMHALHTLATGTPPGLKLSAALEAAEASSAGVRRPFMFQQLDAS